MKKTLVGTILFTLFWPLSVLAETNIDVAFSPSLDCEQKLVKLIDESQDYIDVAVYAINNTPIMQALKNAHKRKVNIRILTDKLQASGKSSGVRDLYDFGIEIKVHSKNKLEHNKFAIFDGKVVFTGSFNWTNAATHKNSENCLFLHQEPEVVQKYQSRFNELWQMNSPQKSTLWFEKNS